jgi:regulator of sirC expression with transglutaminase-like and TPR domain
MADFTFHDELQQTPINLPRAALRYAQAIAYPGLDVYAYLARLEHLSESAAGFVDPGAPPQTQAETLGDFLFRQLGFQGNPDHYDDPRNSYLNEVLDRRLGIPITLSVVFLAVASRLGIRAHGVGLPGHFIVSVVGARKTYYYDPYHGGLRLSQEDCADLVVTTTNFQGAFQPEWLKPVSEPAILTRMLNNLRVIYIQRENWLRARRVIEHLRLLHPDQAEYLRDLGFIHHQNGALMKAVRYYEQYLLREPDAADARSISKALQSAAQQLARRN